MEAKQGGIIMGETNLKSIIINMVTLGIVIFAIMSFVIILQSDNNLDSEDRITNNSFINDSFGDLQTGLDTKDQAESSLNSLNEVPPQDNVGDLSVSSIISTTWNARSMVTGLWNVYIKLPMVILGVSPVVAGAISTILLILIAIGSWAIWKGAIS